MIWPAQIKSMQRQLGRLLRFSNFITFSVVDSNRFVNECYDYEENI